MRLCTNTSPLVSVVLPTFNRAQTLQLSIDSVLAQTYENLELLVVDDGSTDETASIVDRYDDPRVRYHRSSQNRGANAARNRGIRKSQGTIIAFQDSDDYWYPQKLERQLYALDNTTDSMAYCKIRRIFPDGTRRVYGKPFDERMLLRSNFIGTPSIVAHRTCFEHGQFDEELPRRQDWEFCIRMMDYCKFYFVDEILVETSVSENSISQDSAALLMALRHILDKHYPRISQYPKALATFYFQFGVTYAGQGNWEEGRRHLLLAAKLWPTNARFLARALACAFGRGAYFAIFE
jgi:glycosyltransferase involved in cell wall biosynthesis